MFTPSLSISGKFCALAVCLAASAVLHAQDKVYLRLTANDGSVIQAGPAPAGKPGWFEVTDFSFNVEQTLNIGSQSSGAGAGKITFNPFSFTIAPSSADPILFQMAASGTALKTMEVEFDQPSNGALPILEQFLFKLVAVKTIGWSLDASSKALRTQITMEYGGLIATVPAQKAGDKPIAGGWDRVANTAISK